LEVPFDASTTTGRGEQFTIFIDAPAVIQTRRFEGFIECDPMTVSFGIG
jgi:hypothetical protein